ncbi:DHA2 family efflux MFS transporter permease subunit [Catenulispora sp. NF23]|uniref:DHA2 family efflux MFS transporter permease subunit n=1 Tax=Catenulispora pinistramenti TaxID=2705254 RepID=A0ABS5L4H8_9ACTN|nr:DHA2 family efflux MFS transporter permease subunit [Catenulispora pinistramenti]MBS2537312.1 DHA2 family efflux MFS transporter permease subunit [Catenulispora pinistramenti]MBS2553246.1 DHA2 family efflux MFS transporter permease subunit [Catenulispora pinistramenti]
MIESAPGVTAPATADGRKWWALGGLALSLLVVGLDLTVLNVALPTLSTSLKASTSQLQWFANSYNLAMAIALLPGGLLGDRFGRKRMLVIALTAFGVASGFCAFATSSGELIVWRAVLGVGAALLIPLSMSVLTVLFTPEERPRAMGIWATANMLGIPLGPILGGWLLDHYWWGSVFLINLPVVVIALLAVMWLVPESSAETKPRIDLPGLAASAIGLAAITYGLIKAGDAGWGSARALVPMIGGLVVLAGFVQLQRRPQQTLIDLELFRARAFTWGTILSTIVSFALFGLMFTLPQFYQAVEGADAFGTGLRLLPMIAGLMAGVRIGQPFLKKVGPGPLIGAGFVLLTVALAIGTTTGVHDGYGYIAFWLTMGGVGVGLAMPIAMTAALDELTPERAGVGSGLLMTIRQIGGTVAVAVLGTVLNSQYRSHLAPATAHLPAPLADAATRSAGSGVAVAAKLHSPALLESVRSSLVHATSMTMWVSTAFAVVGVLAATQLPRRARVSTSRAEAAESTGDLLNAAD